MPGQRSSRDVNRRQKIFELLKEGASYSEVVKQTGASKSLVHLVSKERAADLPSLPRKPGGRPRNLERRTQVINELRKGATCLQVARKLGVWDSFVRYVINENGGMLPPQRKQSERHLSLAEREEISLGVRTNLSFNEIARRLDRRPSTISREVNRNGGREHYRAWAAERRACEMAKRPKTAKLVCHPQLREEVQSRLLKKHSPRQIALCLMDEFRDQPDKRISHEAIYQSLYIQGRGALRRELAQCLRTGRAVRKSQRREARAGTVDNAPILTPSVRMNSDPLPF